MAVLRFSEEEASRFLIALLPDFSEIQLQRCEPGRSPQRTGFPGAWARRSCCFGSSMLAGKWACRQLVALWLFLRGLSFFREFLQAWPLSKDRLPRLVWPHGRAATTWVWSEGMVQTDFNWTWASACWFLYCLRFRRSSLARDGWQGRFATLTKARNAYVVMFCARVWFSMVFLCMGGWRHAVSILAPLLERCSLDAVAGALANLLWCIRPEMLLLGMVQVLRGKFDYVIMCYVSWVCPGCGLLAVFVKYTVIGPRPRQHSRLAFFFAQALHSGSAESLWEVHSLRLRMRLQFAISCLRVVTWAICRCHAIQFGTAQLRKERGNEQGSPPLV